MSDSLKNLTGLGIIATAGAVVAEVGVIGRDKEHGEAGLTKKRIVMRCAFL
jgi:hypothetical protein